MTLRDYVSLALDTNGVTGNLAKDALAYVAGDASLRRYAAMGDDLDGVTPVSAVAAKTTAKWLIVDYLKVASPKHAAIGLLSG